MKKNTFQLISLIAIVTIIALLVGCQKEVKGDIQPLAIKAKYSPTTLTSTRQLISDSYVAGTCPGGQIEVAVWGDYIDGRINNMQVSVDPGFVLIGGGAQVTNFSNTNVGANALLTAAYPVDDATFTTYAAASKDHLQVYNHRLWVYAIGLKIYPCLGKCPSPVPASDLIGILNISSVTSSPATSFPTATASAPAGYTPLSGGAFIHWAGQGNLLVADGWPTSGGLMSAGKDHVNPSPATITSYCLSISNGFFCFGAGGVTVKTVGNQVQINQHAQSVSQPTDNGYLLSGVAGLSQFNAGAPGRLLFAMYPQNSTNAIVSSKDQGTSDLSGNLVILVTEIAPAF